MTEEERRRLYSQQNGQQQTTQAATQAQTAAPRMEPYSYDLNGDALYQQYRDMYTQQAKRSMRDTMGQAAALTGGYGSTYAQGVGQQAYDQTMTGLTAMVPTLEQQAYQRYKDRYSMMTDEYTRLMQLMTTYGYEPTAEELAGAGISPELARTILAKYKSKGRGTVVTPVTTETPEDGTSTGGIDPRRFD